MFNPSWFLKVGCLKNYGSLFLPVKMAIVIISQFWLFSFYKCLLWIYLCLLIPFVFGKKKKLLEDVNSEFIKKSD